MLPSPLRPKFPSELPPASLTSLMSRWLIALPRSQPGLLRTQQVHGWEAGRADALLGLALHLEWGQARPEAGAPSAMEPGMETQV